MTDEIKFKGKQLYQILTHNSFSILHVYAHNFLSEPFYSKSLWLILISCSESKNDTESDKTKKCGAFYIYMTCQN